MLAFGDLVWVPSIYTIQARYLVDYPIELSNLAIVLLLALNLGGYYIFRSANKQKDTFRKNPNHPDVRNLKTLPTERGTKLIIDGWWGMASHINYTGDLLIALSWVLTGGVRHALPFFHILYFTILLIHRD